MFLKELLSVLKEKERNIIIDTFGLFENETLECYEMAIKYNLSKNRIIDIRKNGLIKLKDRLSKLGLIELGDLL